MKTKSELEAEVSKVIDERVRKQQKKLQEAHLVSLRKCIKGATRAWEPPYPIQMKDGEKIHPEQNGYGWGYVVGQRDDRSDILSHSVLAVQVPQEITELESDRVLIYYAIWASAGGKPKKTSEQYLTVARQRWEMALKMIRE